MPTHRIPMTGWSMLPDTSSNVYFQTYRAPSTNKQWDHLVAVFTDVSTSIELHGSMNVPKNYVGNAKAIVVWTSATATTNAVRWQLKYRAVGADDSESLDQIAVQETVAVDDNAPSAINRRLEVSMNLTSANIAADDTFQWWFTREGQHANDTLVGSALLFSLLFEYTS